MCPQRMWGPDLFAWCQVEFWIDGRSSFASDERRRFGQMSGHNSAATTLGPRLMGPRESAMLSLCTWLESVADAGGSATFPDLQASLVGGLWTTGTRPSRLGRLFS